MLTLLWVGRTYHAESEVWTDDMMDKSALDTSTNRNERVYWHLRLTILNGEGLAPI